MTSLQTFRRAVAAILLSLFCFLFLPPHAEMPEWAVSGILFFQFVPSFLKSLSAISLLTTGFIIVLILSFFAGRIYCSFLCPLGIFTDSVSRAASLKKKQKTGYTKPHQALRYALLLATLFSFFAGSLVLINFLDPYSIFARTMTTLVKPAAVLINNCLSRLLEYFDIYSVSPVTLKNADSAILFFVAGFAFLIIALAVKNGRLYCNTLCPVGTLLGLISQNAVFKLSIDRKSCTRCGKCESICKSSCISSKNYKLDFSRCVTCFNCVNSCPEGSISYFRNTGKPFSRNRRTFMITTVFFTAGFARVASAANRPVVYVKNKIAVKRNVPITPPGSVSIKHFINKCTACYLCVSECPGKVIQPKFKIFNGSSFLMPAMDNLKGYCNFNCNRCSKVCPTGAILPVDLSKKQQTQIGRVVFIKENCIVITQKTECGACSEVCPTKAVYMIPDNNLRLPAINPDICVGCGACEHVCPSIPFKSIYVEGNRVHLTAKKPETKKLKQTESLKEFPF